MTGEATRFTANRGRPQHQTPWRWHLPLGMVGAGLFCLPMVKPAVGWGLVYVVLCASALLAILLGVRRHRPTRPLGWYLLAAAYGILVVGNGVWYPYVLWTRTTLPFPSMLPRFRSREPMVTRSVLSNSSRCHP